MIDGMIVTQMPSSESNYFDQRANFRTTSYATRRLLVILLGLELNRSAADATISLRENLLKPQDDYRRLAFML